MTLVEKILAAHSGGGAVRPGDIVDIGIDVRVARDFGGANVVKNIEESGLGIADPAKTFFTFDCNPTGSDQKYAANQQLCRVFARERGVRVYDIDRGIGTHLVIDEGLAVPGSTVVSTDSHANILGAIGAFGQGMGDRDIAAAWAHGKVWFKVPPSVRIRLEGRRPAGVTAKDVVLNLLGKFGANSLLGYAIELEGEEAERMSLDERITVSSMATEMGAIIILFEPGGKVLEYCRARSGRRVEGIAADRDAVYEREHVIDCGGFVRMVSRPGHPHDTVPVGEVGGTRIDSAFIGSCTNGRMEDMRAAARILGGRKVAPGVVLKVVPATDEIWTRCLEEGIVATFKEAGVLLGNAGCAGCAAGQIGQNGPGEVTVSTGNRNFAGKQGRGEVYLASPETVAASAVAGTIATEDDIPERPALLEERGGSDGPGPRVRRYSGMPVGEESERAGKALDPGVDRLPGPDAARGMEIKAPEIAELKEGEAQIGTAGKKTKPAGVGVEKDGRITGMEAGGGGNASGAIGRVRRPGQREVGEGESASGEEIPCASQAGKPTVLEGRVWIIERDDIDTDMIFHNRYLTITDVREMGKYALDNLEGWEDFAKKAEPGDIVVTGKNFGAGSSRQQAVDCFKSLGVQAILAESFGAIYERNAINAGFPILTYADLGGLRLKQRDRVRVDLIAGTITSVENGKTVSTGRFFPVQLEIYRRGDLLA